MTDSYDDERDLTDADDELPEQLDPEADEADQLEQSRPLASGARREAVTRSPEVPEADALEQALAVPTDVDDEMGRGDG